MNASLPSLADGLALAVSNGIATLTITRPAKRNAVTRAMWLGIADAVAALSAQEAIRAIVLTGSGEHFCAGADIGEFDAVRGDAETARDYEAANVRAFAALRTAGVPTIAAIRGICFGGGFGLAAACDLRIATPTARFSVPAARLGLAYPLEAMADIVQALGPQMARYLTYTAAAIDAEAALRAGFLLEISPDSDFEARISAVAKGVAENAPLSVKASKAAIASVLDRDPASAARAAMLGDATFESADYAEGRAAFGERRRPVFTGR